MGRMVGEITRALLSTKEGYYRHQVTRANAERAVSGRGQGVPLQEALYGAGNMSGIVSGYDDRDRAAAIACFVNAHLGDGVPIFILHNGNGYLTTEFLNRHGYGIQKISHDPLAGLGKYGKLAFLCPEGCNDDDAFFWLLVMETCEALGMESNLANLSSIDWAGIEWQSRLLERADREVAFDLIKRYNEAMAKNAARNMVNLARIRRGAGTDNGNRACVPLSRAFYGRGIYELMIQGAGEFTRRVFEVFNDEYERRTPFVLVLDNVYLPDQGVVTDAGDNVTLLLSGNDVSKLRDNPRELTRKNAFVCLFRHDSHDSAEKLSRHFFGTYRQMVEERGYGYGGSLFHREASTSVTYRQQEANRLTAGSILGLQEGCGYIRIPDGYEGKVSLLGNRI